MAVIVDITASVDGFIALPDGSAEPIHRWFFEGDEPTGEFFRTSGGDTRVLRETLDRTGATVAGRATYDVARGWDGNHPGGAPVVVVTHQPPASPPSGSTPLHFAGNVADAIGLAQRLAGAKDVVVMGGASLVQQALAAGLVDVLQVHVSPAVLGGGVRLVDSLPAPVSLRLDRIVDGPRATHLRYQVTEAT